MTDGDDPWVEMRLPAAEVLMPPDRHAVPASAHPPLEEGTMVTWGRSRGWWLIDAGVITHGPLGAGEQERYKVRPWLETYADLVAGDSPATLAASPVEVPTSHLWVYRDAPQSRQVTDLSPWSEHAWLDRLSDDPSSPPPVLRPRPARELPSLPGQRVRLYTNLGSWAFFVAVSAPYRAADGEIRVQCATQENFCRMMVGLEPMKEPGAPTITMLWAY